MNGKVQGIKDCSNCVIGIEKEEREFPIEVIKESNNPGVVGFGEVKYVEVGAYGGEEKKRSRQND